MKYIIKLNNKEFEVEVEQGIANIVSTKDIVSVPQPVAVSSTVQADVPVAAKIQVGDGTAVKAPMPGVILNVKISAGQQVKKGDSLLVFEAMKMENDIAAPFNGVITSVAVTKGGQINTGDILLTIKEA
jgi:biotin carboxyl carrier protein